jgi:hypothetical protein
MNQGWAEEVPKGTQEGQGWGGPAGTGTLRPLRAMKGVCRFSFQAGEQE